jgi:hypothetical protein
VDYPSAKEDSKALPDNLFRSVLPPKDVLTRFVELRNGRPDEILCFAKQWGPLDGYSGLFNAWAPGLLGENVEEAADLPGTFAESIDGWVKIARRAYSILNIAAKLHQDKLGEVSDWASVKTWFVWGPDDRPLREQHDRWMEKFGNTVSGQKSRLAFEINNWLATGDVKLRLEWTNPPFHSDRKIGLSLRGRDGLFGFLAEQLVLAVARSSGLCTCSCCGGPYAPRRRPNRNRRNYCPQCRGKKVPQRDASRDYTKRRREGDGGRHGS